MTKLPPFAAINNKDKPTHFIFKNRLAITSIICFHYEVKNVYKIKGARKNEVS